MSSEKVNGLRTRIVRRFGKNNLTGIPLEQVNYRLSIGNRDGITSFEPSSCFTFRMRVGKDTIWERNDGGKIGMLG